MIDNFDSAGLLGSDADMAASLKGVEKAVSAVCAVQVQIANKLSYGWRNTFAGDEILEIGKALGLGAGQRHHARAPA